MKVRAACDRCNRLGVAGFSPSERVLRQRLVELERKERVRIPDVGRNGACRGEAGALDLTSNDYLGLAHGDVSRETGLGGAGASRLVFGTAEPHLRLEEALSRWLGVPAALLFSSGFAANAGILPALALPGDRILSDALNHASLIDGCRLAGASVSVYPHLDLREVERLLAEGATGHTWIATEAYFSMDGDVPDLRGLAALARRYRASLIVDEAHSLGVFGPQGRGLCAERGVEPDVLVGTFGKAFGLQGAFVAGSRTLRRYLWNTARSFMFSTATSPSLAPVLSRRLVALRRADKARRQLARLGERFRDELQAVGLPRPPGRGPIVSVLIGEEAAALACARRLAQEGLRVQAIRPPTVPAGSSRLRIALKAHQDLGALGRLAVSIAAALGRQEQSQ